MRVSGKRAAVIANLRWRHCIMAGLCCVLIITLTTLSFDSRARGSIQQIQGNIKSKLCAYKAWGLPSRLTGRDIGMYTCWDNARFVEEPMARKYAPRATPRTSEPDTPRAYWRWEGNITKAAFDKAAATQWPGCVHCVDIVHYKIVNGTLFVSEKARPHMHREVAEEMLKVVLYLFPIPDMEFLLHFGDGCTNGLPVISWNVCRQYADAGFTMPSYSIWRRSLGPKQMSAYHACLQRRYPPSKRKPLAVWRGSTTDTRLTSFNKDNYLEALRIQLHQMARNHSDILDVRIADPLNCDDFVRAQIPDIGSNIPFEDFNQYCVVVDVDGNGWSDRFGQLIHFNTPILKIASNHTAFFEPMYEPDIAIKQFARDLSDLPAKAREMIVDCKATSRRGSLTRTFAANMQKTTRSIMHHVGIAEGFAYTLLTYKRLSAWTLDPNLASFVPVNTACCSYAGVPRSFAKAVEERLLSGKGATVNPAVQHHGAR